MELTKENLEKKQDLILKYHELIVQLEMERKNLNSRIADARKNFIDLIKVEATNEQLSLFENFDHFKDDPEN